MPFLDEDRLYENIEEKHKFAQGEARKAYSDVLDTICEMPSADVEEIMNERWISVENRLPNIDPYGKGRYGGQRSVRVLCACKQRDGRTFVKEGYYEPRSNGEVFWRIPGSIDSVTHWMILPEPPKIDGKE